MVSLSHTDGFCLMWRIDSLSNIFVCWSQQSSSEHCCSLQELSLKTKRTKLTLKCDFKRSLESEGGGASVWCRVCECRESDCGLCSETWTEETVLSVCLFICVSVFLPAVTDGCIDASLLSSVSLKFRLIYHDHYAAVRSSFISKLWLEAKEKWGSVLVICLRGRSRKQIKRQSDGEKKIKTKTCLPGIKDDQCQMM